MRAWFFLVAVAAAAACSGGPGAASVDATAGDGAAQAADMSPESLGAPDALAPAGDGARDLPAAELAAPPPPEASDGGGQPAGQDAAADGDAADTAPPAGARTIGDLYCAPGAAVGANPLPADRTPRLVPIAPPGGISFLEGPVWLAASGVLLFSEWNGGHRVLQLTPPQTVEVYLPSTGSNGLAVTPAGDALLMISETPGKAVSRIALADKRALTLVQTFDGEAFVQPNDLAVRADGTIYFTDYQAGRLYRRAVDGKLSLLASATHANGVGLSPDEKTLYLNADTHTLRYPLAADGGIGAGTDLATGLLGADGLAIDCAGNVYIAQNAGGAVVVVTADGTKLGELTGLPRTVTNAAFGGPQKRTLYVTTSSALYTFELQVPGLPY